MMNSPQPMVPHQSDAASLEHETGDWNKESAPATELPVLMSDRPREVFYDAREVYGGY
jgi:hypothetical protein